jgi:hypothetical protein
LPYTKPACGSCAGWVGRRWGGVWRSRQRTLDGVEFRLALDREQRDLAAAARLALERPAVDRCAVVVPGLQQAEGDHTAVPVGTYRQQGQAAASAGGRPGGVSGNLDHVEHGSPAAGDRTSRNRASRSGPASRDAGTACKPPQRAAGRPGTRTGWLGGLSEDSTLRAALSYRSALGRTESNAEICFAAAASRCVAMVRPGGRPIPTARRLLQPPPAGLREAH